MESPIIKQEEDDVMFESKMDEDFCINCNSELPNDSVKYYKISRIFPTTEGVETSRQEISIVEVISIMFKVSLQDILSKNKCLLCDKCGKLLELSYNTFQDFIQLTGRESLLSSIDKPKNSKSCVQVDNNRIIKASERSDFSTKVHRQQNKQLNTVTFSRKFGTSKLLKQDVSSIVQTRHQAQVAKKTRACESRLDVRRKSSSVSNNNGGIQQILVHKCSHCHRSFKSASLLNKHKTTFHRKPKKPIKAKAEHNDTSSESFYDATTIESQSEEELLLLSSSHQCKLCSFEGLNTAELKKHLEAEHKNSELLQPYRCSICELDFGEEDFREHLSIHDNNRGTSSESKFECKLCESKFSIFSELKQHYNESHPFVSIMTVSKEDDDVENSESSTQNCKNLKSSPKGKLKKDGKSEKSVWNCEVCGKKFGRHDHMKLHLRIHTGEKPYVCKLCGKAFSDPRGLAYHEITHSNERPYCCIICGLTFKRLHHLNDHEKNHNDVPRPFICSVCGKAFKYKKHLNSHSVIHQGTKEHQCELCFKAFNRKDNLRQHVKKIHKKVMEDQVIENNSSKSQTTSNVTLSVPTGGEATSDNVLIDNGNSNVTSSASSNAAIQTQVFGSSKSSTTTTIPVAITISDQDQIVYMTL